MANENYIKVENTIPAVNLAKDQKDIGLPSKSLQKEQRTLGSFGNQQNKEINPIAEPTKKIYKEDRKIDEPINTLKKDEVAINDPSHRDVKIENSISTPEHKIKKDVYVDPTSYGKKEEDDIALPKDHPDKKVIDITVTEDSMRKSELEIPSVDSIGKKEERNISPPSTLEGDHKAIWSVEMPDHLKKTEQEIASTIHGEKEEEEIPSSSHYQKEEQNIAATTHGKKEEQNIASTTHDKKEEKEIASTIHGKKQEQAIDSTTAQKKIEQEVDSVAHGKKQEQEIASTTAQKKSEQEVNSVEHDKKSEQEIASTTAQKKSEQEIDSVEHDAKTEFEIDTTREHQEKTIYSYDEILQEYLVTVQQEQNAKKPTTEKYSTQLNNNTSKAFTEALPVAIPTHTLGVKEQHAGLTNIPRIDGFDVTDVGNENYIVEKSSVAVVNGKTIDNITAPTSLFDPDGNFGRTSNKIADMGSKLKYAESNDPKVFDTSENAVEFTKVRNTNSSEYRPVYNALNLIPPRTGLVDLLKNAANTFGLGTYTSFEIFKPDMNNDTLRFAQRALTGEAARYVYSRLYSNVLLGFNPSKKKEAKPLELSVSGVLDQADKVFDVLNPVVDAMLINPLDLFKDKEALEYKGYIGSMSNQINRSASGIYKSMSDYYGAVRSKILLRLAGQTDKLLAINSKIEKLALENATTTSDAGASPTDKKSDITRKDSWWKDHQLESYNKKKGKLEASVKKLNLQYKEVVIGLDSPSEYTKYIDDSYFDLSGNSPVAWSVSMKRGEDGPELGADQNTEKVDPKKTKSTDWRSYNLNRKPNSKDDFENVGFLNSSEYDVIRNLKERATSALKEQSLYADNADKVVEDLFTFQYILTDYGNNYGNVFTEINEYYKNISERTKVNKNIDPLIHAIPSKEMSTLYANSLKKSDYSYVIMTGDKKEQTKDGTSQFNDPHLSSLFETISTIPYNPRSELFDTIKKSDSEPFSNVKDQLYRFKNDSLLESADSKYDINLTSIDYKSNSAISNILQNIKEDSSKEKMTLDEKKNIFYQKSLNALSAKDETKQNVRRPKNQMQDLAKEYENDSKMKDEYKDMFSFGWFNTNSDKGDRNSDITHLFEEDINQSASYTLINKENTITDALYREAFTIALNGNDPEVDFIKQIETIADINKSRGKKYLQLGLSMVSSKEQNVIKAVAVPAEKDSANGMVVKVVKKDVSYDDATTSESLKESIDGDTFIIQSDETVRNKESAYYKNITKKRNELFPVTTTNQTIKMTGNSFGSVKLYDTGLGGLTVSSAYNMNNQENGNGAVYFTIPFQFNPEISGESRSANWNSVTAFGRTHEHFVYSNSGSRGIQFKTTYAITDFTDNEIFDKFGDAKKSEKDQKEAGIERNNEIGWQKGWTEDYVLMILNMYRSLTQPVNAYSTVTPPIVCIEFGKLFGTYARTADKYTNARWVISEYSIDANLSAGYTPNKTPRLYDVTLSMKEVFNGWHDLQDFYTINKHLKDWFEGTAK